MMKQAVILNTLAAVLALSSVPGAQDVPHTDHMTMHSTHHEMHAAGPAVSFAELRATLEQLNGAVIATERYRDARAARDEGYEAVGPYVTGMGYHYVKNQRPDDSFDIEHPPILLYEKDATAAGGLRLAGVSYLFNAPTGPDEQPVGSPVPPVLAKWHKHANLCVMPDRSVETQMDADECMRSGGRFSAETQWMVHAWIWKDSPAGVFSPFNPNLR
jgi:hypothetical protein